MGDTLQRKRERVCLSSYSHIGFSEPPKRYEERFSFFVRLQSGETYGVAFLV